MSHYQGRCCVILQALFLFLFICVNESIQQQVAITTIIDVCNAQRGYLLADGPNVQLQSNTTYRLLHCTVVSIVFTTISFYGPGYSLDNVAIVVEGGTVMPTLHISYQSLSNLSLSYTGVVVVPGSTFTTPIIYLDNVYTVSDVTIVLDRVTMQDSIVSHILGLRIRTRLTTCSLAMRHCRLVNVTTGGLIAISGVFNTRTSVGENIQIDMTGGMYRLIPVQALSVMDMAELARCTVVSVRHFFTAAGIFISHRDNLDVSAVTAGETALTLLTSIADVTNLTRCRCVVESVTATAVLTQRNGTTADALTIKYTPYMDDMVMNITNSSFTIQAGGAVVILFYGFTFFQRALISITTSRVVVVADQYVPVPTTSIIAAPTVRRSFVVLCDTIDQLTETDFVLEGSLVESRLGNSTSSTYVQQNYTVVAGGAFFWTTVLSASRVALNVTQTNVTVFVREATTALNLFGRPFSSFSLTIGVLSITNVTLSGGVQVVMTKTQLMVDAVVSEPVVAPANYLWPAALSVSIVNSFVQSNSKWTNGSISIAQSSITVIQISLPLTSPETSAYVIDEVVECTAFYVMNLTAFITFLSLAPFIEKCSGIDPMFMPGADALVAKAALTNMTLTMSDCTISTAAAAASTGIAGYLGTQPYGLHAAVLYAPSTASHVEVRAVRVNINSATSITTHSSSSSSFFMAANCSAVILRGTVAVGLDVYLEQLSGISQGLIRSFMTPTRSVVTSSRFTVVNTVVAPNANSAASGAYSSYILSSSPLFRGYVTLSYFSLVVGADCTFVAPSLLDTSSQWLTTGYTTGAGPSSVPSRSPPLLDIAGCSRWNHHPLTAKVAHKLLTDQSLLVGVVNVGDVLVVEQEAACVATQTVPLVPPLHIARPTLATAAAVVTAMALSSLSATPLSSVTSIVRLQSSLVSLKIARQCQVASASDGSGSATPSSVVTGGSSSGGSGDNGDALGSAVFDNPLQISIANDNVVDLDLQYAAGCVLGNLILSLLGMVVLNAPYKRLYERCTQPMIAATLLLKALTASVPGEGVTVMILLLTPTVTSSVAMLLWPTTATANNNVSDGMHALQQAIGASGALCFGVVPLIAVCVFAYGFPLRSVAMMSGSAKNNKQTMTTTIRCCAGSSGGDILDKYADKNMCISVVIRCVAGMVRLWLAWIAFIARIASATSHFLFSEHSRWIEQHQKGGGCNNNNRGFMDLWSGAEFLQHFEALISGYRGGCQYFMIIDVATPIAVGALSGYAAAMPMSVCSPSGWWVMWLLAGISIFVGVGSIAVRPCATHWDNFWAIFGCSLSALVAVLCALRDDDSTLSVEVTTVLAWASLVPAMVALLRAFVAVCLRLKKRKNRGSQPQQKSIDDALDSSQRSVPSGDSASLEDTISLEIRRRKKSFGPRQALSSGAAVESMASSLPPPAEQSDGLFLHNAGVPPSSASTWLEVLIKQICDKKRLR